MNDSIVADALQAHWSAQDETVHAVGFSATGLRRRARRRTATMRALAAACLALVAAGTAVTLTRPHGSDEAPADGVLATLVTAGWTLTLTEAPTDPPLPGFSDVTTTICVTGHGSDRGCTGSFATGPGSVTGVGQGTGLLAGFVRGAAARVEVSLDAGPARPAAVAGSDDGGTTLFAMPWSSLGVDEATAFITHRITVHAYDAAGTEVARFGVSGEGDLAAAHPGRRALTTLPAPQGWVVAWQTTDGAACVSAPKPRSLSPAPQWCGHLRSGTTVLGWTYGEGGWGLLLHVPRGTRAVRVGDRDAEIRGDWATVPVAEELSAQATVTVTDDEGRHVAAGTVQELRVAGDWAGARFTTIPDPSHS